MGLFTGIEKASATAPRNYFRCGTYWANITRCKYKREGFKGQSFIVEFKIVHVVDRNEDPNLPRPKLSPSHNSGEDVSIAFTKNDKYPTAHLGRIKSFIMTAAGLEDGEVTEDLIEKRICDEKSQPLTNTIVEVHCAPKMTKESKQLIGEVYFRREVPKTEVLKGLTPDEKEKFFPGGWLEKAIEAERVAAGLTV